MAGSSVFAMGSQIFSNQNPLPPAFSTGSAMIEWSLLGGWVGGLWFINITAIDEGPGDQFDAVYVGLAPIDPATGNWADVYSPNATPVIANDGGVIRVSQVTPPMEYALVVPLIGNAYELVLYGNAGTSVTISSALIVHD